MYLERCTAELRNIADAEEAACKAQAIAISAAQAFGDVAAKLSRAKYMLDVGDDVEGT